MPALLRRPELTTRDFVTKKGLMLPPLLFSVRLPTLLAKVWRTLLPDKPRSATPRCGRLRIVIFRLDAMGDVVMTTPFFRELKRNYPNSHCTAVVQHAFRPLLVTNPLLDEVLTLPEIAAPWLPRRAENLLAALLLYWRCLRKKTYDIAISPRWDVDEHLATLLCLLTSATQRVGYTEKTSLRKQQLNRGFDAAFSLRLPGGPVEHEVTRNLAVVEALGGAVHDSKLEVRLTERDREVASCLLANVPPSSKLIALGIGANCASRRWPLSRYADTVSRLAQRFLVQPIILCSAGEREQALALAALLSAYERSTCDVVVDEETLNLPQLQPQRGGIDFSPGRKPWVHSENQQRPFRHGTAVGHNGCAHKAIIRAGAPLREACAVLERCDLFIGNDSGTAHLAAAMDCKTIVISRHPRDGDPNHSNSPVRFGPYCRQACVLQPATGLDACTSGCRVTEPHCITTVSVDEVVSTAQAMLGGTPARAEERERTVLTGCQHSQTLTICHHEWTSLLICHHERASREGSALPQNLKFSGISE
jgi:heptosyltransferase III